jgi:hypothetical protein
MIYVLFFFVVNWGIFFFMRMNDRWQGCPNLADYDR